MTWTSAQLRRLSLWLLCAMLLAALAPTVSRARAWSQGSQVPWMEICTIAGTPRSAADAPSGDTTKPGMAVVDHCALCVLSTERMVPPSSPFEWHALPQAPPALAVADLTFTPFALHWVMPSRAPPACV
jgi:Protein of unknown function (DUF2946)